MPVSRSYAIRLCGPVIFTGLLSSFPAIGANVPAGVTLAPLQEIVRGNGDEPPTLDVEKAETNDAFAILYDLFEGLVQTMPDGKVVPGLAVSWETADNKVWTFHLRPDLTWSDGSPLTAQDVVFSWRRLTDPKTASPYASFASYAHILNADAVTSGKSPTDSLGVKALDDHTVQVTLDQPVSYFLQFVAHPSLFPISANNVKRFGEAWSRPGNMVSSGAFKLDQWVVNEKITLVRNDRYWDNAHTVINKVTFLPIHDLSAELNRYLAGGITITDNIPAVDFSRMKKERPKEVRSTPIYSVFYFQINNRKPPFTDVRVRQALNLALDKTIIADKVIGMGQQPAWAMLPLSMGEVTLKAPAWAGWTQEQRVKKAQALLSEAGYSASHPLTFTLLYNTNQDNQRIAIAAASMWGKVLGARVTLQNQEWKTMVDNMHQGQFDLVRYTWGADYSEPSTFLNTYRTGDSQNTAGYASPAFDAAVKAAGMDTSLDAVTRDYQKASDIIANDTPVIPVFYGALNQMVSPKVGGYAPSHLRFYYTKDLYLVK
ncbi:oligopeptide transport system substrate-binding protein [Pantoea sp. PNA 14-12]|uniref:ABC transporter substrate-binding protein n=1 Tax=Pantoea TaxID=53335 RepID=UPI00105BC7BC|nr:MULTISPECIES: ABC transporter substrate-binding protein [Pantoea]TDS71491.1 oligopeptide transport system substrate-binding protein [Pantoea sp. PNA 14-12]